MITPMRPLYVQLRTAYQEQGDHEGLKKTRALL